MLRRSFVFLAAIASLLASGTAAAVITYGYGPVTFPHGTITGALTATESAIADGILRADEFGAQFTLAQTTTPYQAAEFDTSELWQSLSSPFYGEIYVDRVSGKILSGDFIWGATDTLTGQAISGTMYHLQIGAGGGAETIETPLTVSGGGFGAGGGGPGGGTGQNITYAFATTSAAPLAGTLTGSLVVPKAAIADGRLVFGELLSATFTLSGGPAPFAAATYTLGNFSPTFLGPAGSAEVLVDPVSGAFLHDFMLLADSPGKNQPPLRLFPHRFDAYDGPSVQSGQGIFTVSGGGSVTGTTTPVPTPTLHPTALAVLALMLLAIAQSARLRRR